MFIPFREVIFVVSSFVEQRHGVRSSGGSVRGDEGGPPPICSPSWSSTPTRMLTRHWACSPHSVQRHWHNSEWAGREVTKGTMGTMYINEWVNKGGIYSYKYMHACTVSGQVRK